MTQKFKGDQNELKIEEAARPAFDAVSHDLDDFFLDAHDTADFFLMLYDEGRVPFSNRVPREDFVTFIRQVLPNFIVTGTFEMYLFLIKELFGESSGVFFEVTDPGKLTIVINAANALESELVYWDFVDGAVITDELITDDGSTLVARSISGIDTEYKIKQIFSEIIPAGIVPDVSLSFFTLYDWVAEEEEDGLSDLVDEQGNNLVLYET